MDCILQYLDYENGSPHGMPREIFLRPQELKERHLYEHALLPVRVSEHGKQKLQSEGFYCVNANHPEEKPENSSLELLPDDDLEEGSPRSSLDRLSGIIESSDLMMIEYPAIYV